MNWNDYLFGVACGVAVSYVRYRVQLYVLWRDVRAMLFHFKRRQDTAIVSYKLQGVQEAISAGLVVPAQRNTQPEETFK